MDTFLKICNFQITITLVLVVWLSSVALSSANTFAQPETTTDSVSENTPLDSLRTALSAPELRESEQISISISLVTALLDRAQNDKSDKRIYHEEVSALISQALLMSRTQPNHKATAELLRLNWFMNFQKNQLDGNAELLLEALSFMELAGSNELEKAHFYTNLYFTYILSGEYQKAITYMRLNVVNNLETGDTDALADDFFNIGDAYLKIGELDIARRYFQQSQSPYREQKGQEYFVSEYKLATVDRLSGDADQALRRHLHSLRFFDESGSYRSIPVKIEISKDYIELGELEKAQQFAELALDDGRIFAEQKLDASLVLMQISLIAGNHEESLLWLNEIDLQLEANIEETSSEFIHPFHQIRFADLSMKYYIRIQNSESAVAIGERALGIFRHIRNGLKNSGDSLMAWTAQSEPFISQFIAALYIKDSGRILNLLEDVHSSSLLAHFSQRESRSALGRKDNIRLLDDYLSAEKDVVDALSESSNGSSTEPVSRLELAKLARDQARERYLLGNPGTQSLGESNSFANSIDFEQMSEGDVFLRFYTSQDISFVLVKDKQSESFHTLPDIKSIEKLVARVVSELEVVGLDTKSGILSELSQLLPARLLSASNYKRVIVVPDATTHSVPFSAININPGIKPYLALSNSFSVLRTYSLSGYLARPPPRKNSILSSGPVLAIFADPFFESNIEFTGEKSEFRNWSKSLKRLPFTAEEAANIAKMYEEKGVVTYLGPEATSEALLSENTRSAHILHIASHGYFNASTPDIVGIATSAQDINGEKLRGFLGISDLLQYSFSANLIVISGCETMLGRSYRGLGVRGLSQGFIAQGAGAVLGTLWKIPDRTTSEFMRIFYSELLKSQGNVSEALHTTRQLMMNSRDYSQPSFWAAFALTSSNANLEKNVFIDIRH